ncbi:MAG: 50S ribosomal protein L21e [Candidatus Marsarchaeota archaeon]|jgi:large subunit ribosomal protein L21e|nr:50S ribosomal protein L21e [Candidatus Marsarchaeota archaeon]MCL5431322.1 50S ribosomal protein L21e [Candidatus Marsarchaeota archaeon]
MTKKSRGLFSKRSRNLARHHKPSKLRVRDLIKNFEVGERVAIVPKGGFNDIPHPRYRGRVGVVEEKRGSAYVVKLRMMAATKTLIVPARHLEKA